MADDLSEMSALKARLAALEARVSPADLQTTIPKRSYGFLKKVIIFGVIAFVALLLFAAITGPRTVGDLAKVYTNDCIAQKGYGYWRGSSGTSLEKYCEAMGSFKALMEDRKEHPERY